MNELSTMLLPDRALKDPKFDKLGYSTVARKLAQRIFDPSLKEGLVISIEGEWGSGKSTFIKFILFFLKKESNYHPRPLIINFNPWLYSGHKDLICQFFILLNNELNKNLIFKHLAKYMRIYVDLIKKSPLKPALSEPIQFLLWVFYKICRVIFSYYNDINKQKELIIRELKKRNRQIVIIIDDLDRLTDEEVRQIFQLVKAIADFPNLIYILAFDRDAVSKALSEVQMDRGSDFIDKIVQLPINLPKPESLSLKHWFEQEIESFINFSELDDSEKNRWTAIKLNLNASLTTPRRVVRILNSIRTIYPVIEGEVNPICFASMEVLRILHNNIYIQIRDSSEHYWCGVFDKEGIMGVGENELRNFHEKWLNFINVQESIYIKRLLVLLFPKLGHIWNISSYSDSSKWSSNFRICDESVFGRYFQLAVSPKDISNVEFHAILDLLHQENEESFIERLLEMHNQEI